MENFKEKLRTGLDFPAEANLTALRLFSSLRLSKASELALPSLRSVGCDSRRGIFVPVEGGARVPAASEPDAKSTDGGAKRARTGNFKQVLTRVEAFVFDVDGVFTDGGISLLPGGDFLRTYHARDGYAVSYAMSEGYKIYIITGGWGDLLTERFKRLKVTGFHSFVSDKVKVLTELAEREGFDLRNTLYMGDDIPDLGALGMVGIPVCPADACHEVVEASIYVSQYAGGRGCVRDIIEQVLRAQGRWLKHTVAMHTL